jgi:dTMP kinase
MPLIVFEGPDGCGKTTQMSAVGSALQSAGWPVSLWSFPTCHFYRWRSQVFDHELTAAEAVCLHMLDFAGQARELSAPDRLILLDRYYFSTAVYQSGADLSPEQILQIARHLNLPAPELCFLLTAAERDMPERLTLADRPLWTSGRWHQVRDKYARLAASDPMRWVVLDPELGPDEITARIVSTITSRLSGALLPPRIPHPSRFVDPKWPATGPQR